MTKQINNLNSEVSDFLNLQNHLLRKEIEQLRICILSADENLSENIKWNGPNYCFDGEDRITMRIQPPTMKQVQIIFHRGAKKQEQPKNRLIDINADFLTWKENDRAIATFKNMMDIEKAKTELTAIVKKWIDAAQ